MEQRYVMTAFAKDRPGIIAAVSRLIYETGCNLEDTTMTRLLDEFAMVILFSGKGGKPGGPAQPGMPPPGAGGPGFRPFSGAVTTSPDDGRHRGCGAGVH